jgi:hypothetical protein
MEAAVREAALRSGGVSDELLASVRKVKSLMADAAAAGMRARHARAFELFERALAVAEAELQPDSLVLSSILESLRCARSMHVRFAAGERQAGVNFCNSEMMAAAWRDPQILALSQRSLSLLHARWRNGTLDKLRVDETSVLFHESLGPHAGCDMYISTACTALGYWPPPVTDAAAEERVCFVYGALRTALMLDERGLLRDDADTGWPVAATGAAMPTQLQLQQQRSQNELAVLSICNLLRGALKPDMLKQLRAAGGLSHEEEAALRRLTQRQLTRLEQQKNADNAVGAADTTYSGRRFVAEMMDDLEAKGERALARHGLRACALPECEREEPEPKAFKLCSRCQNVVYCSKEHQAADWRHHKREDCTRPAA